MQLLKSILATTIAILLTSGALFAQVQQQQQEMPDLPTSDEVTDEEVTKLVNTIIALEPIQLEAQEKIEEAVEAEDITFERFQQMMMAMQNPQMADEMDISDEEMSKIQTLQPKLMEIQGEAEQQMMEKIEEYGLTMERYRMIIMGAQQDPELMARVEAELDDE